MESNDFTLGSVAYILCYITRSGLTDEDKRNNLQMLLEFAKSELFPEVADDSQINNALKKFAMWIETIRLDYRNPSAHSERLKKIDAISCFNFVTDVKKILRIMMEAFKV